MGSSSSVYFGFSLHFVSACVQVPGLASGMMSICKEKYRGVSSLRWSVLYMPHGILRWVWLELLSEELEGHNAGTLDRALLSLPQGLITDMAGVMGELISFMLIRHK